MEQKILSSRKALVKVERTLFDTVGDELRRARIAQDLSVEAVAKRLNIKSVYIYALENNDYTAFPAIVYGVGFLRTYTVFLGLETEELVERFKSETTHLKTDDKEAFVPTKHNVLPDKKIIIICMALLIGLVCIWYGFASKNSERNTSITLPLETVVIPRPIEPIVTAPIESDTILNQDVEKITEELNAVVPLENPVEVQPSAEITSQLKEKQSETVEIPVVPVTGKKYGVEENAIIIFSVKDRAWVNVKENGKTIFDQILSKGDAYFVPAEKVGLVMRTGNARGLEVFVNGKSQGLLSATETVKKNILLAPETFIKN